MGAFVWIWRQFCRFPTCQRGQFTVAAAIILPVLIGITGGGMDLYIHQFQVSSLQNAADNAALAAAREASLKGWNDKTAKAVADNFLTESLAQVGMNRASYKSIVAADPKTRRVSVTVEQDDYGYFFLGYFKGSPQITVNSVAAASGQANVCIIVKSEEDKEAFKLDGNGKVTALKCSAYSNSIHPHGLVGKKNSRLQTAMTCSAGGYQGSASNFGPIPLADCPKVPDPLQQRAIILNSKYADTTCDHKKFKLDGVSKIMYPGTYCGDTHITKGSIAYLRPGTYVFKEGKLKLEKNSSLVGNGVGFVFIGDKSKLEFKHESTIVLTAPAAGAMAGILVYAQKAKKTREFKIESNDAKKLVGTIYLPHDKLKIGADENGDGLCDLDLEKMLGQSVNKNNDDSEEIGGFVSELCETSMGKLSAWTAIVVDKLKITNGVELIINTNYDSTPIPVPDGLGPVQGNTRLVN